MNEWRLLQEQISGQTYKRTVVPIDTKKKRTSNKLVALFLLVVGHAKSAM
jgi:hypothetical protein